jgi:hypothetical protein
MLGRHQKVEILTLTMETMFHDFCRHKGVQYFVIQLSMFRVLAHLPNPPPSTPPLHLHSKCIWELLENFACILCRGQRPHQRCILFVWFQLESIANTQVFKISMHLIVVFFTKHNFHYINCQFLFTIHDIKGVLNHQVLPVIPIKKKWKYRVKAHYRGPKMLSHCIVFQGCPCLNFNHGNIGAYFSKVFA